MSTPSTPSHEYPSAHADLTGFLIARLADGVDPAELIEALNDCLIAMCCHYGSEVFAENPLITSTN